MNMNYYILNSITYYLYIEYYFKESSAIFYLESNNLLSKNFFAIYVNDYLYKKNKYIFKIFPQYI